MVVLAPAIVPAWDPEGVIPVVQGEDGFVRSPEPLLGPCRTDAEGVFVAGTAAGPKDIPDSVVEGGAAATEAAIYLRSTATSRHRTQTQPEAVAEASGA